MTEADDLLPADPARRRGLGATAAWMMLASLGAGRAQAGRTGTTPALAFTPVPMTVEAMVRMIVVAGQSTSWPAC